MAADKARRRAGHVTGESALPAATHFFGKPYMAEEIAASLHVLFH
jgi:hypothetical protein